MSVDWGNLFKPPDDPGVYPPEADYQPDPRSRNPNVPENWGDILGQMLGTMGNVRRAQRNQQAQSLVNAWNEAKAQGPEAAQAFLRNPGLPPWFREKVLSGMTPEMFDPAIRRQAQQIYTQVQSALRDIYAQAAAIEDPTARDQFIDQQLEALKKAYPDWGSRVPALPRGTDGHYALPNVTQDPLLDKPVILPNGKPMMGPDGKPMKYKDLPPELRARVEADAIAKQMRSQVTGGKTLGQVAPQLAGILKGSSFEAMLNGPADAFLDETGQPDTQKIHQLIVDAENEKNLKRVDQSWVWIDPTTKNVVPEGTPGAIPVQSSQWLQFEKPTSGADPAHRSWRERMDALTRAANSLDAEVKGIQTALRDPISYPPNSPQRRAQEQRLQQLQTQLDGYRKAIHDWSERDPDLESNKGGGNGGDGKPIGGKPGWWWYRNQKGVLMDAIRQAEGVESYGVQKGDYAQNRVGAAQIVDRIFNEWLKAGKPGDFLAYLASKYAPVGAANDPTGLNKNWLKNVSAYLEQHAPRVAAGAPGGPAGGGQAPHKYTQQDYEALSKAAFQQAQKGMPWPKFWEAISKANPGMDQKLVKQIYDAAAASWKRMKTASDQDPVNQAAAWIKRAIQKALSGQGTGIPEDQPMY